MLKQDLTCRALFQSGSTGHQHQDRQGAGPRNTTDNTATPAIQGARVAAFVQRLRELGWIEGRTVAIEHRWGEGQRERYLEIAAEFVRLKVDITRAGPANFSRPRNEAPGGRSQAETQADAMNLHPMPLPTARGLQSSFFNGFGNNSPPAVSRSPGRRARWPMRSRVLTGVASSSNSPSEPADCCRPPAEDWRQAGPAPFAWS